MRKNILFSLFVIAFLFIAFTCRSQKITSVAMIHNGDTVYYSVAHAPGLIDIKDIKWQDTARKKQPSAKAARPVPEKNDGLIKYKQAPRMAAANVKLDSVQGIVTYRGVPNTFPDTMQRVRREAVAVYIPPSNNKPRRLLYIYLKDDPNTRVNLSKKYYWMELIN